MRTRHLAVPAAVLLLLGGCAADDAPGEAAAGLEIRDVTLLHEIGSIDDPDESLTSVGDIALTPDGRLLIGQGEDGYIRLHASDGSLIRTIGRRGEGPGEFGAVGAIMTDDSGFWVYDGGNHRMHRFTYDGELVADERWPLAMDNAVEEGFTYIHGAGGLRRNPDGQALSSPGMMFGSRGGTRAPERMPIRQLGREGVLGDTVALVGMPFVSGAPEGWLPALGTGVQHDLRRDGTGVVWVDHDPGTGVESTFTVGGVTVAGDTLFHRRYAYTPIPTPADEIRREVEDGFTDRRRELYGGKVWVPETFPPVSDLTATSGGEIWLAREERQSPTTWWVLDGTTGEHIATLSLPEGETVREARGDVVITTSTDEFDVAYVKVWRVGG